MTVPLQLPAHIVDKIMELIDKVSEPYYLYDTAVIRHICRALQEIPYKNKAIHLATQASNHEIILNIMREEGILMFVNSLPHLQMVLEHGYTKDEIIFTASAMNETAMQQVHDAGAMVNLDSMKQVNQWQSLFPDAKFGIRCNIGSLLETLITHGGVYIGKGSRLGLSPEEIKSLSGNNNVAGLHLYLGTNINEIEYFHRCYSTLCEFATLFPQIEYINVGGGFALENNTDGFNFTEYGLMVTEVMAQLSNKTGRAIKLIMEPGRVITGQAGYFVCRVTDIKTIEGRQLVGVNASCAQFPRPLFHPDVAFHPATIIKGHEKSIYQDLIPSAIYGCSTYSNDYLSRDVMLPVAEVGDIIVLGEAGSYCAACYTNFLGFPPAKEIFI
ncbi:MAG: hypothetical protein WCO98_07370 [bacterium]